MSAQQTDNQTTYTFFSLLSVLDVAAFERVLGPCMDIMKRNIDAYEEQLVQIFGSKINIADL
jgi:cAMP-dependent protein kinase regulator